MDSELVRRGLAPSRSQARELVAAGLVTVGGAPADKGSRLVEPAEPIEVLGPGPAFVSRGGMKLANALERLEVDVSGHRALDAGASTGGFTDCLLQRGVNHVFSVDVGRAQLHERLHRDPRVTVLERTDVRSIDLVTVGGKPVELVVADLSFISLRRAVPVLAGPVSAPGADLVLLVKPQFEVGRTEVSRGRGVVRDPALWSRAMSAVASSLEEAGAAIIGAVPSSLAGARGNVEFFVQARAHAGRARRPGWSGLLDAAVREVG